MIKPDILVLHPILPDDMAALASKFTLHSFDARSALDGLGAAAKSSRAIVTNGHTPLERALIEELAQLELVACGSAGFDSLDTETLKARGIRLTNTSPALTDDVADTAILLMLAARRNLIRAHAYVQDGSWGTKGMFALQSSVKGKNVGIVGLGQIGAAIAARCAVMGANVGYFGRTQKAGVDYKFEPDLTALARWSDILILAVSGGAGTRGLVSKNVIQALGPNASLINVSRGTVVDEPALIAALQNGDLASAGLDVFENEPAPDEQLTALANVTLFPHHASGTFETRAAMSRLVRENLIAYFDDKPLVSQVF
ncbi:Glyoxylate/hydroxypyruvate reductase B [Aquimixticola soesokkakensis]|uniref:Glyoxylate/hydroxypyruvate reductase B n=1 Tax=Aquimixticola soesokkakensis TaxID=1519096 RepID=A0A1Y5TQK4_9RHOB|nr:2-hydroxyacid dehydrogenase [Aquimixticola soesokkakensis]SLN67773.1 Glyoxylate/hydroxypyruvate reductase B [Aquimixticola soesokkakensis]